ncbi:hypothetical protein PA598K_02382 [Paenibacillus sp. 598K]|uniref:anti-sigma-I factor RsgI family protein n=1 Tax=Paenibacillus sp. 598K TaxID=1117987 RepID=UPI000FF9F9B5|nr:anti-sigma factor domain-containing protein [Paenibacillus sp. 598K]GBF74052.1 hypothetical protein PA598K_02382 [Paenibacillus sp. 598K]
MKRGIIVDIKARHWIVLTPDGQFRHIRKTHVAGLGEQVAVPERSHPAARRIAALAAAIAVALVLVTVPGLIRSYSEVAYYLAIDFNPSLELGVDKHERVVELRSWNADGAEIIRGMTYENIALQEVLEQIVERARTGPYLTGDSQAAIVTSIAADLKSDDQLGARIAGEVRQLLESALDLTVTVLSAPVQLRDEAEVQGVTPGQMAVHLLSRYNGDPIRLEELREQSIRQAAAAHGGLQTIMSRWDDEEGEALLRRLLLQEREAAEGEPHTDPAQQPAESPVQEEDDPGLEDDKHESPEDAAATSSTPAGDTSAVSAGASKQTPEKRLQSNGKGRGDEQQRSSERESKRNGRADQRESYRKERDGAQARPESDRKPGNGTQARPESDRKPQNGVKARPESYRKERDGAYAQPGHEHKPGNGAQARPESGRKPKDDSQTQREDRLIPQNPRDQREGGAESSKPGRRDPNEERRRPAKPDQWSGQPAA